ncbi:response regulator [Jiella endophytica]|nr:response regulator [Jiella endophytica]
MSRPARVLIVDDDFLIATFLEDICLDTGADVVGVAHKAETAVELALARKPDVILMDVRLGPGADGVEAAAEIQETLLDVKVIFVTGSNEPETIARINKNNPYSIFIKPVNPKDLSDLIESCSAPSFDRAVSIASQF